MHYTHVFNTHNNMYIHSGEFKIFFPNHWHHQEPMRAGGQKERPTMHSSSRTMPRVKDHKATCKLPL